MKSEPVIAAQVRDYLRSLAPDPRRLARAALAALGDGKGDCKPLGGELEGLHRLRVGQHRFVYRHRAGQIEVFFAAPRRVVYEFLAAHLREILN